MPEDLKITLEHPIFERPFHSKEFDMHPDGMHINGVRQLIDRGQVELALGIAGHIKHLSAAGWDFCQWQYRPYSSMESRPTFTYFMEFFGDAYASYIRTDSRESLLDAGTKAVATVQKWAQCERTEGGHNYAPHKGFNNGLMVCTKCGFNGYSGMIEVAERKIEQLAIERRYYRQEYFQLIHRLAHYGITTGAFDDSLHLDSARFEQVKSDQAGVDQDD